MDEQEKKAIIAQLCKVLAKVDNEDDMERLLEDLCTFTEVEQMAQRLECARLLMEGNTYVRIIGQTDISSATLSRVSRCLHQGSGGYRELLPPIFGIKEEQKENQENQ